MKGRFLPGKAWLLLAVLVLAASTALSTIQVQLNGQMMTFSVPPTSVGGSTLVPLRGIFEALGARVDWEASTQKITATRGNTMVMLWIGNANAQLNGQTIVLNTPAMILNGSTMVPLRFVSEALGAEVHWLEASQTVIITDTQSAANGTTIVNGTPNDQTNVADTSNVDYATADTTPAPVMFGPVELDNLLSPIALYPDPLLAQILPASTFPDQLARAAKLIPLQGGNQIIDTQNWDISVKAVAYYPTVLNMMVDKPEWTTAVGQAEVNQPFDVMRAIQRLRHRARDYGYLETNPQQRVYFEDQEIRIVPVQARYIYVPRYEPAVVYTRPRRSTDEQVVAFGLGLLIGVWLNRDMDYQHNKVYYHGWKNDAKNSWVAQSRPSVSVKNTHYVNNSFVNKTVVVNHNVTTYNITNYVTNIRNNAKNNVVYQLPASKHTLPPRYKAPVHPLVQPGTPEHHEQPKTSFAPDNHVKPHAPVATEHPGFTTNPVTVEHHDTHTKPVATEHPGLTTIPAVIEHPGQTTNPATEHHGQYTKPDTTDHAGQITKPVTTEHPGQTTNPATEHHGQYTKPDATDHPGQVTKPSTTEHPGLTSNPASTEHHAQPGSQPKPDAQPANTGHTDKTSAGKTDSGKTTGDKSSTGKTDSGKTTNDKTGSDKQHGDKQDDKQHGDKQDNGGANSNEH